MDNALASKQALNLSVGLTSVQIAALTHNIVWMEERVIDGETVLAPATSSTTARRCSSSWERVALALQTLNEKTGLNFKSLQNSSNHGCDGCAVAINGDTITVLVMDAKSSVNGVNKAGTPHGDPATRLRGWLANESISQSDPALARALRFALLSEGVKVQGVTVKVGLPAPGKTGQAEIKVEPWLKK